jgi:excisionase family DNA binding protein
MVTETLHCEAALTVEELAARIKYHPESVRRAIRQGRIHALPFGQSYRIPPAEVASIMATGLPYRAAKQKTHTSKRASAA